MSDVTYSIIIPAYNEEAVLHEMHRRMVEVMDQTGEPWEIILVNDGSRDRTAQIIAELHSKDARIKGISLSRNGGLQVALSAGIDHASGKAVGFIDADLQDPPELFLDMIKKWREGYDVIYGQRGERDGETAFKKLSASMFYRLINKLSSVRIPMDTGEFRLMDRKVVDAIKRMPERHRFMRGMIAWAGFKQTGIVYHRHARFAGDTKFPLSKMFKLAQDAITSFSYVPLQLATLIGFIVAGLSLLAIVVVSGMRLFLDQHFFEGQTTTLVMVLFLGGVQLISLGIIGEYLGRIYDEVKARPLYLIQEKFGLD